MLGIGGCNTLFYLSHFNVQRPWPAYAVSHRSAPSCVCARPLPKPRPASVSAGWTAPGVSRSWNHTARTLCFWQVYSALWLQDPSCGSYCTSCQGRVGLHCIFMLGPVGLFRRRWLLGLSPLFSYWESVVTIRNVNACSSSPFFLEGRYLHRKISADPGLLCFSVQGTIAFFCMEVKPFYTPIVSTLDEYLTLFAKYKSIVFPRVFLLKIYLFWKLEL